MARLLPVLLLIALTVYALVAAGQADGTRVRLMPRWLWMVAIVCLPLVGPLAWLVFGRPVGGPPPRPPRRPLAPDDDPDFLRGL